MNTSRRRINERGQQFIPMNIDGNSTKYRFFDFTKLCVLLALIGVIGITHLWYIQYPKLAMIRIATELIEAIITIYITRFYILEEGYYRKVYEERQRTKITTPSSIWSISTITENEFGATLIYKNSIIAVVVKLEADTITDKNKNFKEYHFDAMSDFIKELMINRYSVCKLDRMMPIGQDNRLNDISNRATSTDNKNVRKLAELQIGNLKVIEHDTMQENEYLVVYTRDRSKLSSISEEVSRILDLLSGSSYRQCKILNRQEFVEMTKDLNNVNRINIEDAQLEIYRQSASLIKNPVHIREIEWISGDSDIISDIQEKQLDIIGNRLKSGEISNNSINLRRELRKNVNNNKEQKQEDKPSMKDIDLNDFF